jgi:hypothetical protein
MEEVRGYFHPAGTRQTPKHSEYEMQMSGIYRIMVLKNAKLIDDSFIQVINEKKPVFAIIASISKQQIWKLDNHLSNKEKSPGKIDGKPVLTSDLGAALVQKIGPHCDGYIKIRMGDEAYYAGDVSNVHDSVNNISYDDLLSLVSGEISWNNLKGRSILIERKRKKELSCQEKNAQFAEELKSKTKENQNLKEKLESTRNALASALKQLMVIPDFIKKIFSAV